MKRRTLALLLGVVMAFSLTACGGEDPAPAEGDTQEEPLDLTGMWTMTNGNQDAEATMEAKITENEIEIVFVIEGEDPGWDEWLYWSGSYAAPTEPGDSYSWTSEADGKAESALLGSSDETKEFSYESGVLSFDVTMDGQTITAEMERTGNIEDPIAAGPSSLPEEGNVGDYYVVLKDCSIVKDYDGNDALLVNYSFTNNSEETTSGLVAVYLQAFQDGVELEIATVEGRTYDEQKDIRPGVTMDTCQAAYVLTSDSPVEVEVSDMWSDPTVGKVYEVTQ